MWNIFGSSYLLQNDRVFELQLNYGIGLLSYTTPLHVWGFRLTLSVHFQVANLPFHETIACNFDIFYDGINMATGTTVPRILRAREPGPLADRVTIGSTHQIFSLWAKAQSE